MSESDALDEIIKKGAKRMFAEQITSINNALKDEEQTGVMNSVKPKTLEEAVARANATSTKLEDKSKTHI